MEIKAVVFDLFGTLVYAGREENKPHRKLYKALGFSEDEIPLVRTQCMINDFSSLQSLAQHLRPEINIDCQQYELDLQEDVSNVTLYPETIEVLQRLKERGLKIGLISNLSTPFKQAVYNLGLTEYFETMIFSCDAGMVKPNPGIYQRAIKLLKLSAAEILMTGDQLSKDVIAPINIGMRAVHLDRFDASPGSIPTLAGIFQHL